MMFTNTFRESLGDISAPKYNEWLDRRGDNVWFSTGSLAIYTVWMFWYINVILTLIVMLNFLIAEVGHTFEKIMSLGQKNQYRQQAILNAKNYLILYFIRNWDMFKFDGVIFTSRDDQYEVEDEEQTQLHKIQKDLQIAIDGNKNQARNIEKVAK